MRLAERVSCRLVTAPPPGPDMARRPTADDLEGRVADAIVEAQQANDGLQVALLVIAYIARILVDKQVRLCGGYKKLALVTPLGIFVCLSFSARLPHRRHKLRHALQPRVPFLAAESST